MKVAIIGANGQLGTDLVVAAKRAGHQVLPCTRPEVDITQETGLGRLENWKPDAIVNTAAMTNVDLCETESAAAFAVNAQGAGRVASLARQVDAQLLHVSTDYVFAGDKPGRSGPTDDQHAYTIEDGVGPVNVYGQSKAEGEVAVQAACPEAAIVRISSVVGHAGARGKGGNFIETMLRLATEGKPLRVVNDQWMTPTFTRPAADAILDLVGKPGVHHVTSPEACSWFEFASHAVHAFEPDHVITPCRVADFPRPAPRPVNSALVATQAMEPWQNQLDTYLEPRAKTSRKP